MHSKCQYFFIFLKVVYFLLINKLNWETKPQLAQNYRILLLFSYSILVREFRTEI